MEKVGETGSEILFSKEGILLDRYNRSRFCTTEKSVQIGFSEAT